MPRKRTKEVRKILRDRIQKPETAEQIADALLSFLNAPDKAKSADVLKLLDFAMEEKSAEPDAVPVPDASEDLSGYSDAELWAILRKLEGGKARGP